MTTFLSKNRCPENTDTICWTPLSFFIIIGLGLTGLWMIASPVIIHGLMPGDIADGRFNNYVLEHFFSWITGKAKSFWNADFFYPFPNVLAFSDNLLGSGPFYAFFRYVGLNRESAFQAWYILGYALNYITCSYVFVRLRMKPAAAGFGAFIFTFGLPVLAQQGHEQLLYRFGIPLSTLALFQFAKQPRLMLIFQMAFWLVWQFYAGIYTGYFLMFFLASCIFAISVRWNKFQNERWYSYWPNRIGAAWEDELAVHRIVFVIGLIALAGALLTLLSPYIEVSRIYGFTRNWKEVLSMLPRLKSYLLADNSLLWKSQSQFFADVPMRHEHQLFIGMIPSLLLIYVSLRKSALPYGNVIECAGLSLVILFVTTLSVGGVSIYTLIAIIPGFSAIRAVTRIIVILLFPVALLSAIAVNDIAGMRYKWVSAKIVLILLSAVLVCESMWFHQYLTIKTDWEERIVRLKLELSPVLPENPILFVSSLPDEPWWWAREIDGMILAQEMGWKTLNGYSGNVPPGYVPPTGCNSMVSRITAYFNFFKFMDPSAYHHLIERVVPVGFADCNTHGNPG